MEYIFESKLSSKLIKDYLNLTNKVLQNDHSIGFIHDLDYQAAEKFLKDKLVIPRCNLLNVYDENKLVGTGIVLPALHETWRHNAEMTKLMVDPDYQGKGIGRKIVKQLEDKAKALGFIQIVFNTWDLPRILNFYLHCGYKIVGKIPNAVKYKEQFHDANFFYKKL